MPCVICGVDLPSNEKLICRVCSKTKLLLFAAMLSLDEIKEGQEEYEEDYVQQVLRFKNKRNKTN